MLDEGSTLRALAAFLGMVLVHAEVVAMEEKLVVAAAVEVQGIERY